MFILCLCGVAQAQLPDGARFPQNAFGITFSDMVHRYGEPQYAQNGCYIWADRSNSIQWCFEYPNQNGCPVAIAGGTRYGSHEAAVRAFLAACETAYRRAGGQGETVTQNGNPAVCYQTPVGDQIVVTFLKRDLMVVVETRRY